MLFLQCDVVMDASIFAGRDTLRITRELHTFSFTQTSIFMKKIFLFLFMVVAMTSTIMAEKTTIPIRGQIPGEDLERNRNPINLPIKVIYDSDANAVEVWCDDDNIRGEIFVYDETGVLEGYSAYMNVSIELTNKSCHCIIIRGDYWESIGYF